MATRHSTRSTGPAPSTQPAPATRATRQHQSSAAKVPASSPNRSRHKQEMHVQLGSPKNGPVASHPIARRSARAPSQAASVRSINTVHTRVADDSEEEEDVVDEEAGNQDEEEEQEGQDLDSAIRREVRHEIMAQSLPSLLNATEKLVESLEKPDYDSRDFFARSKMKQGVFLGIREVFTPEGESGILFIDWSQLDDLNRRVKLAVPSGTILALANLATVLNSVEHLQHEEDAEIAFFLANLDSAFPLLLTTLDHGPDTVELALDIRTALFIETLAREKKGTDAYAIAASFFCENPESHADYPKLFAEGPFIPLVEGSHTESELCMARLYDFVNIIKKPKNHAAINKLRAKYPTGELLERIKHWAQDVYAKLVPKSPVTGGGQASGQDVFHDAEEEISDSQSLGESQPIVRLQQRDQRPSLFTGADSVRFLRQQSGGSNFAPPSNQQQAAPPPSAPSDYPEHSNEELLTAATPPPNPQRQVNVAGSGGSAKRRLAVDTIEEEDEEDENAFQQDDRPLDPEKRAKITASLPTAKRPRVEASHTISPSSRDRAAMPPPPVPSREEPPSSPFAGSSQSLKSAKEAMAARARSERPPAAFKYRQPWSDRDVNTLIELVVECRAGWATIENSFGHRFEHPRNQQAFRDKARNLKVDYLLTDTVLPPCFDLVRLSKKEEDRLIGRGKNPWREERDLDEQGRPINTETNQPVRGEEQ